MCGWRRTITEAVDCRCALPRLWVADLPARRELEYTLYMELSSSASPPSCALSTGRSSSASEPASMKRRQQLL